MGINKNYLINMGLLVSGLSIITTGLLKLELFRINSGFLNSLHDVSGVVFAVFALIHVVLHFRWIISATQFYLFKKDD